MVDLSVPAQGLSTRQFSANHRLVRVSLLAIILVAPIPAGSNLPIVWCVWAATLSALTFLWCFSAPTGSILDAVLKARIPIVLGCCAIGFAVAQSLAGSLAPSATLLGAIRLLTYAFLFVLLAATVKNTGQLADVLLFGIALNAIVALLFLYGFNDFSICGPKQHYLGSATGTYINRNAFASLLSMGLILGVSRFAHPQFDKGFWARVCACGAIVAALLATQSRAAILLGLGIASICFAVSVGAGQRRTLRVALFVLPFVAVVAGLTAVSGRSVFAFVDLQTRAELWHQTLIMIADRPFTGFGLDTFPMAFERYHLPSLPVDVVWLHPHNTYLTLWSELGMIAGSLIPLAVGWVFLVLLHAQYPSANHSSIRVAAIGVISFASLHALVDFSMEIQANVFLFIAIIALALVECRSRSETPVEVENG